MSIAIVAGALANKPLSGGEAWVRLSWILGLCRLGFDVYFVEQLASTNCVDRDGRPVGFESSFNLEHFESVVAEFGLEDRASLLFEGGESVGVDADELGEIADAADLLLNISGHLTGPLLERPRLRAYLDLDPGFTQAWHADAELPFTVSGHDRYLTVGLNVGRPGCPIPTGGLGWIPTLPPVVLDEWPLAQPSPGPSRLTTVATWRSPYGGLTMDGREMGLKHHQFRRFIDLPERVEGVTFEIALDIHPDDSADLESLRAHGWVIKEPRCIAGTPVAFREYVCGAHGEFSVAQGVYVESSSGWFSDRTAAYLASGRPALIQDTSLGSAIAGDEGLLAFASPEQAVVGVTRLFERYAERSRAARSFAETHLDSDRVIGRVLERLGVA